jgi:hypothetical protein
MSKSQTFTILSVGAPLVEVDGTGPTTDRPSGVIVPDGVRINARVQLRKEFVRRFRVDAPPSTRAVVSIAESPYGVYLRVRRFVPLATAAPWWRFLAVSRWPRVRDALKRRASSLLALWYLLTDEDPPAAPSATNGHREQQPFTPSAKMFAWRDVGSDDVTSQVTAYGGDLVIVTFVNP